ncbi:MAG: acetyl-CoA C-acetyltransferase [Pseudomonadota bacterium]
MAEAYIVAVGRTAGGRRGGALSGWHPADLGAQVIDALVARSGVDPAVIDDVIFGCVMQAGAQTMNIARNVVLSSRLPEHVPGTTVDRQCGSSQQALQFAAQAVMSGTMDVVIAGGVESMTQVPMGSAALLAIKAGLAGPYSGDGIPARYPGVKFNQFAGAEAIARKHGFTRDQLDAFALESHHRAAAATRSGAFDSEIVPIAVRRGADADPSLEPAVGTPHTVDEGIRFGATAEAIGSVKLLSEDGLLTAATSSQICDGASAVLVVNEAGLKKVTADPLARIHHLSVIGGDPVIMLETPLAATERALARAGMKIGDIDLYEVNEAFASVPLAWLKALGADPGRLNVNGGAIALGHPLGASGTKLMATLVSALQRGGGRYGLQTMCEGGGLANVTIVERL